MRSKLLNFTQTTKHKAWVLWYILKACWALLKRAIVHDLSKYQRCEARYFEQTVMHLHNTDYGSEEYERLKAIVKPALDHHFSVSRHHPEHYGGDISLMTPLDRIEMVCDWRAANHKHKTASMKQSFEVNRRDYPVFVREMDGLERDAREIGLM